MVYSETKTRQNRVQTYTVVDLPTTNALTRATSENVEIRHYPTKTIFTIRNDHAANSLTYEITALDSCGNTQTLKAETVLAAETLAVETLTDPWDYFIIKVKSTVPDSHCTTDIMIRSIS